jgi:hypothetical protein
MNTISQIHDEAMAKLQLANQVLKKGQPGAYKTMLNEALALEKTAAYSLVNDHDCEPTRSVLFRSAAAIAINAEDYNDAIILAQQGLNGNPFTEIKDELQNLLYQAENQVSANLSVLHDDGAVTYEKAKQVILSTTATAKQSVYDVPDDSEDAEITEEKASITAFFAKKTPHNTDSIKKWMLEVLLKKERIQHQIRQFLHKKLPLLNDQIGKEDTRWIWHSKKYIKTMYEAITHLNGNGLRIYLGQFEASHFEYAGQTCLIWIPTRQSEHTGQYGDDIIIEDELTIAETSFLEPYYIDKEIANQRIINYRHGAHPMLSSTIEMNSNRSYREETRSVWYSRKYLENMIDTMNHLNASGMRIYFGCYPDTAVEEDAAESYLQRQISFLIVLTRQSSNTEMHQNIIIERDENYPAIQAEMNDWSRINSTDYSGITEPPYHADGSKFPYTPVS